jgi:hypothetical protein
MKTLKFNHRIKATYKARKNAKGTVYSILTVKAASIKDAIIKAAQLINKPLLHVRVIDVNGTPAHLINKY